MGADNLQTRLAADLASAAFQNGKTNELWDLVDHSGDVLHVRIAAPGSMWYLLALDCAKYWEQAIAGQFVDFVNRQCVATAWPQGNGTFQQWIKFTPGNLFICWDQDRIGISKHADWAFRKSWNKGENQLVSYLNFIHTLLWLPKYGYRRGDHS